MTCFFSLQLQKNPARSSKLKHFLESYTKGGLTEIKTPVTFIVPERSNRVLSTLSIKYCRLSHDVVTPRD